MSRILAPVYWCLSSLQKYGFHFLASSRFQLLYLVPPVFLTGHPQLQLTAEFLRMFPPMVEGSIYSKGICRDTFPVVTYVARWPSY
jgi:hypothetical protein